MEGLRTASQISKVAMEAAVDILNIEGHCLDQCITTKDIYSIRRLITSS
jgi:hypothetical protein